jgi:amino acid adenylation domain-containing protein
MDRHGNEVTLEAWDGFRLSRQQERTLSLARAGHQVARTIAGARLVGAFDRALLARAATDVVAAHESLRTSYRQVLGERSAVLMVIDEPADIVIVEMSAASDAEIIEFCQAESQRDADANAPSPTWLALVAQVDGGYTLVLSAARMSLDAPSADVFFRDLQQAYAARIAGGAWGREDTVQYADFAQWQLEQAEGKDVRSSQAALRQAELAGIAPMSLPLEVNAADLRAERLVWAVPADLAAALRAAAAREGTSLRATLLAGWVAALWHAAGRPERIAVEANTASRPFDELAHSIGSFETAAPVFAELSEQIAFGDLARALDSELAIVDREEAVSLTVDGTTQSWRRVPGYRFQEHASFTADAALRIDSIWTDAPGEPNKVALVVEASGDTLSVSLRHQALGLAGGGAESLMACVQAVFRVLGANVSQRVADVAMLDDAAAQALVAHSNPKRSSPAPARCWHVMIEDVARRTPDALAMRCGERRWTYAELDGVADRIAAELRARRVGPGTLVALHLERSDFAIAAMLGIAKAGGAYVPVDPSLPVQRQALICAEAGLRHAVTTREDTALLPPGIDCLALDPGLSECGERAADASIAEVTVDSPAYVLFTSGSTGVPKGVVVSHAQLSAYLDGVADRLELGSGPIRAVALGSLATDLGNTALFLALVSGGELEVIPAGMSADSQAMAAHLSTIEFDLMKITPSHLAAIIAVADTPEKIMPQQRLVLGGEPFSWGWFTLFQSFAGDCHIYNHYGPTETTVGVLCGQTVSNSMAGLASTVPLGTPMRNARTYILDPEGRPLPPGIAGELWIGGDTVSSGYLTRREGQAERFFPDPWSPAPGARMYRSGDRVRALPGGAIEFLGRIDRQVKVRGFRVELGEVEAAMRQHPRVSASLVVEAGESSAVHLVGYIVDVEGSRGAADWLRPFLAERLPEFMVPTHFVALDRFPLTTSGKVDASMLPEPGSFGEGAQKDFVEPRSPTEIALAAIMADLLLLKRVGANDDFFEIGGHSLLATQLLSRLRNQFSIDIRLRSLFENSVVSELAEQIDARLAAKAGAA